ncbi:MAG: site-2 protease family protein [Deltaproteobacteria bacterium]|jgi:Zn-dependent protease|nr:site-2 protease family protein [Deltaproteobacteria bacterium]
MESLSQAFYYISIGFIPFMLGMICHEVAHGWVAEKAGDPTARHSGRITINPLPHIDPMGLFVFVLTAITSSLTGASFIFGWAKPVPINPRNFRNLRQGLLAVSLAGAGANILLAAGFAGIACLAVPLSGTPAMPLVYMSNSFIINTCVMGVFINLTLAVLNLLPIPPLDGSKVLASLLPARLANAYMSLGRFGLLIILVLLIAGALRHVLVPPVFYGANLLFSVFGLSLY